MIDYAREANAIVSPARNLGWDLTFVARHGSQLGTTTWPTLREAVERARACNVDRIFARHEWRSRHLPGRGGWHVISR